MADKLAALVEELEQVRERVNGDGETSEADHLRHEELMSKVQKLVETRRRAQAPDPDAVVPDAVASPPPAVNG